MLGLVNYILVASVCCWLALGIPLCAETTEATAPDAVPQLEGNAPSLPQLPAPQLEGTSDVPPSLPAQATTTTQEEHKGHPFAHIVERNVFALKPVPPPASPEEAPPPPPPPLAKVILTGILNVLGPPRALLEVTETEPGKQAAQGTPKKPILREGERDGNIEVVSIDVEKSTVRIKNGGFETNLTFMELKQGGGGVPGAPAPGAAPPALNAAIPVPPGATAAYQPSSTGRGVVMGGATQLAANTYNNNNSANPAALGSAQFQRQLRIPQTQPQQPAQEIDAATQFIELKAREELARRQGRPHPPLPPLPGIDDQPPPTPTPNTPPPQTGPPGLPGFPPPFPIPPR